MEYFQLEHISQQLDYITKTLGQKRDPIDSTVLASATQPWIVNYHERKHVFIWFPTAQTVSFDDYGTGPVQAQVWMNLGMPEGTRMFITSSSSQVECMIRCTDEIIP